MSKRRMPLPFCRGGDIKEGNRRGKAKMTLPAERERLWAEVGYTNSDTKSFREWEHETGERIWEKQNGRKPNYYDLLLNKEVPEDYIPLLWFSFYCNMPIALLKNYVDKNELQVIPILLSFIDKDTNQIRYRYKLYVSDEKKEQFVNSIPSLKEYIEKKKKKNKKYKVLKCIRPLLNFLIITNRMDIDLDSCMKELESNIDINEFKNIYKEMILNYPETQKLLKENEYLRARIEALEEATPAAAQELPYTLWREVLAMRKEGMTDKQIAAKLHDKGQGASKSQLGALLYTGKQSLPAGKTLQDKGTELFR